MNLRNLLLLFCAALLCAGCLGSRDSGAGGPDGAAPPADGKNGDDTQAAADGSGADAASDPGSGGDPGASKDAGGAAKLDLGELCVASAECGSGHCALPCEGFGLCAPGSCTADADCAVPGSSTTHCCVEGSCTAIQGSTCGERKGGQGASCAGGGQTDCAKGKLCLQPCVSTAFCASACADDTACEALDPALGCWKVVGDGKRCVPDPDKAVLCETDGDCAPGVCAPALSFDGTGVIKSCMKAQGTKVTGDTCAAAADCKVGFCFGGSCTGACTADSDCACGGTPGCKKDQVCLDTTFETGPGTFGATELCNPRLRCGSDADCGAETCAAWPETGGWAAVCQEAEATQKDAGAPCAKNSDCKSGACWASTCAALCTADAQCGALTCQSTDVPGPYGTFPQKLCR